MNLPEIDLLSQLPSELKLYIFQHLNISEQNIVWMVCKSWRQIIEQYWLDFKFDPEEILTYFSRINHQEGANYALQLGANRLDLGFIIAAGKGHLEMMKHLENSKSILPWKVDIYQFSFDSAAAGGHIQVLKYLNQVKSITNYQPAFMSAVEADHLEIVKLIIDWQPRPWKDQDSKTCGLYSNEFLISLVYHSGIIWCHGHDRFKMKKLLIDNFPNRCGYDKFKDTCRNCPFLSISGINIDMKDDIWQLNPWMGLSDDQYYFDNLSGNKIRNSGTKILLI